MKRLKLCARAVRRSLIWCLVFVVELAATVALSVIVKAFIATHSGNSVVREVHTHGLGVRPQLVFACELPTDRLQALFSDPAVAADLAHLKAGISLAVIDLSPGRADLVRKLNSAGIPVTAWIVLPKDQGYYLNAGNIRAAAARFAEFEKWTADSHLRWASVGLDIEPNFQEFSAGKWRLATTLIRRCLDTGRVSRAREAYAALIRQIQSRGYPVDTYQFPFIADERKVHSTLLERLFGIVDVRGNREVLMVYSSFNHRADSGLIWEYGPEAQVIAIGSTSGGSDVPARFAPLNWNEFCRDLLVASHFSPVVAIYSLEGCVQRAYLGRLKNFDWAQSVTIQSESIGAAVLVRACVQAVLWTLSRLPSFAAAILILDVLLVWRQRGREKISKQV